MVVKIRRDNDPFKKYWWVLLVIFGLAGGWLCMPLLETPAGAPAPAEASLDASGEGSLDSVENPQGAPGSALNLSMDGLGGYRKSKGDGLASSLYQAPAETAASTGTAAAAAPAPYTAAKGDLASALKYVAKKSAASDPSGWGGKAAQKGFNAPKANFGSMSGMGGGSASAATMSAGGGGQAVSGFGTNVARTGSAATRGLKDDGLDSKFGGRTMNALKSAQSLAISAARNESLSGAAATGGRSFDGGGNRPPGSDSGGNQGGVSGVLDNLDRAPINLKANDPNLSKSEFKAAPVPVATPVVDKEAQMREMIKMMLIMALIGGIIGCVAGPMAGGMVGQMAGPMMQSQTASASSTTPVAPR